MRRLKIILVLAFAFVAPISAQVCPDGWTVNPNSELCYKFGNKDSDWSGAFTTCRDLVWNIGENFVGGLAKVDSKQEIEFIKGLINDDKKEVGYWIGANDEENEGSWRWADGSTVNAFDWHNGEPNNYNNDEDCVVIGYDFWKSKSTRTVKWFDEDCASRNKRLYAPICTVRYEFEVSVIKHTSSLEEGELYCTDFGCDIYRSSEPLTYTYKCNPPQRLRSTIQKVLEETPGKVDDAGPHFYIFEPQDQRSDKILEVLDLATYCLKIDNVGPGNGGDSITFASSASGSLWIHISDKPLLQTNQCSSNPSKPCYNKDSGRCCSLEFVRNNKRLKCPRSC